jgi:hypothetical protein
MFDSIFTAHWLLYVPPSSTGAFITTRLATGLRGVRIPIRSENFSLLRYVKTGPGTHPASFSLHFRILLPPVTPPPPSTPPPAPPPQWQSSAVVMLLNHLHLQPIFRRNGAILLRPLTPSWHGKLQIHLLPLLQSFNTMDSEIFYQHSVFTI